MAQRLIPYKVRHLLLAAAMWAAVALLLPPVVSAQEGPNRAALVVRFADGSLETHCVSFSEPFISGMELLTRSGLQVQVDANSGLGGAVCRLQEFGCAYPVQDCFCRCQGAECEYWAYYHWLDGGWQYSQIGASSYRVTDGALEGWSWGPGNFSSGTQPPQLAFDQVCAVAAVTPLPTVAAAAALEGGARAVGSFLAPVVHAQENAIANAEPVQSMQTAPAYETQLPGYAAYLLLLLVLAGVALRVVDRKKKAAVNAVSSRSGS